MVSVRARLLNWALPLLPISKFAAEPEKIEERLPKVRSRARPKPSQKMRARFDVVEDNSRGFPVITVSPKGGAKAGAPHLLYLHGGGYVFEIDPLHYGLVERLCQALGATVTVPLYPLAPEHKASEVLDTMLALYDDLAQEYGAERITIMGDSAGGGMSLALAQMLRDRGEPLPASLVLYSPWLDAAASGPDQPEIQAHDRMLTIGMLRKCGELYRGELAIEDPHVSPLFGELEGLPPMAVFAGTYDVLLSDARRLVECLDRAGMPTHVYHEYDKMMHVWMIAPLPESKRTVAETAQFVREHLA